MTSVEEQILVAAKAALDAVTGAPPYRVDLRNVVVEEDTTVAPLPTLNRPLVVLGFQSVEPGDTLRTADLSFVVDVMVDKGFWLAAGISPQQALLRVAADVRLAMHSARTGVLNVLEWQGTTRYRSEDGSLTANRLTLSYAVTFSDARIT